MQLWNRLTNSIFGCRQRSVIYRPAVRRLLHTACRSHTLWSLHRDWFVVLYFYWFYIYMIWVTLNMPSAAEECREPSGNFTLSREWSPCIKGLSLYSFSALVGRCPATQSFFLGSNFHCSFVTRNVLHFLWYVYHRYDHLVKLFFFHAYLLLIFGIAKVRIFTSLDAFPGG